MSEQMKDSGIKWIGSIPESWSVNRVRGILSFGSGLSITKDDLTEDGTPVISYGQIHSKDNSGTTLQDSLLRYVPDSYCRANPSCIVHKGDFVFADTSEDYEGTGNCAFNDRNDTLLAGYHTIIARPTSEAVFPKYIAYLFQTDAWRSHIRAKVMGVKVFSITKKILREAPVILPSIPEQEAIADFLDEHCAKLDGIISDLEHQIEVLQKYKKSLITETVTKGLDKSVPMKDSGIDWIGQIPEHWEVKRLKYILAKPLQYGANETGDEYNEDWPRYIRITDITENNELKDEGKQSLPPNIAKPYLLKDGDILFARSGATVGKTFYYSTDCGIAAFAGYLIKAQTARSKVLPRFLYFSTLSTGYENWKNMAFTQATIQNIGADKYSQFVVTIPPLQEQEAMIKHLDSECKKIDKILATKETQLETMKKHKASLIFEYVTGKKRVKEAK